MRSYLASDINPFVTNATCPEQVRATVVPPTPMYPALRDRLVEAKAQTPTGEFHVDADALRKARAATPVGEFHNR